MSSLPVHGMPELPARAMAVRNTPEDAERRAPRHAAIKHNVLIVAPTLDSGAADAGAVELTRILADAGYRPLVAARAGRLVSDVTANRGEFVALDTDTVNPVAILRTAAILVRLIRDRNCIVVHALGRAPAWAAWIAARVTRTPFLTSWYKGFREQNYFKRLYNRVMVAGDRIIAVSDQLAHLIHNRYGTPWERIAVVPLSVDLENFDPDKVSRARIEARRAAWGVTGNTKIILVTGRLLRRKGHHTVVRAARLLKERGLKDFLFVFVGEDRGRTRYTGELWDLVLQTGTVDVVRMAAPVADMAAAYAAATVVVSAAVQPEGLQRAILEAQAMARPVVVSDFAAGPDIVLAEPSVPAGRITGLRFPAGNDAALAATLLRLFAMPDFTRRAIGQRGRQWVTGQFAPGLVAEQILQVYADVTGGRIAARKRSISAVN